MPPLVTQIADGENGGVMMNEFPPKYLEVVRDCSGTPTPMMNVTEYLEQLFATGLQPGDLPVIQPLYQQRIWQQMTPGDGPDRLADVIEQLRLDDSRFHVDGGSWTNDLSWVRGYDQVLIPMEQASSKVARDEEEQRHAEDVRYECRVAQELVGRVVVHRPDAGRPTGHERQSRVEGDA